MKSAKKNQLLRPPETATCNPKTATRNPKTATRNPQPGVAFSRIFRCLPASTGRNPMGYIIYYFLKVIYIRYAYTNAGTPEETQLRVAGCGCVFREAQPPATTRNQKRNPQPATRNRKSVCATTSPCPLPKGDVSFTNNPP